MSLFQIQAFSLSSEFCLCVVHFLLHLCKSSWYNKAFFLATSAQVKSSPSKQSPLCPHSFLGVVPLIFTCSHSSRALLDASLKCLCALAMEDFLPPPHSSRAIGTARFPQVDKANPAPHHTHTFSALLSRRHGRPLSSRPLRGSSSRFPLSCVRICTPSFSDHQLTYSQVLPLCPSHCQHRRFHGLWTP